MARQKQGDDLVHERPAWILPALVLLAVTAFSGFFLYHYFGPTPGELLGHAPRASAERRKVEAVVGGTRFLIPENYTRYPSQRSGGAQPEIAMHALLPDFSPFTPERQSEFTDNSPSGQVIYFTLHESEAMLPAERRLKEIYSKYFVSPKPEKDRTGLEKFSFRDDSGYKNQDLLVGADADGRLVLLLCQRVTPLVESPNCTRTLLLTQNLALTYRYKRAHLNAWQRIDELMIRIVTSFEAPGLPNDLEGTITD
ncbi:MAG: hypothetical protein K8R18_16795 [Parvibaculum sp.]|uniref:hypothetical protein n=1 Tax=Parvibaculum sp. TaxID=2024848 RepID=UPI0025CED55A|nr:hypothetical protein [Parvibaculum sp.]MCE9651280.1 hypothetical protein [Parvibaculum sp.]